MKMFNLLFAVYYSKLKVANLAIFHGEFMGGS